MDNQYDEIEIDLIAILWRMAAQWKLILLTAVVCGLLFGAYSYWSDYRQYQESLLTGEALGEENSDSKGMENEKQLYSKFTDTQKQGYLTKDEKDSVDQLISKQKRADAYANYVSSSFLTNVDPYDKQVLYLRYRLTPKGDALIEETSGTVTALLNSSDTVDRLSESLGSDIDSRYVREIFRTNLSTIQSEPEWHQIKNEAVLELSAVVLPKISADTWKTALEEAVHQVAENSKVKNAVDIVFLDERVETCIDMELLSNQNTAASTIRDNASEIRTAVKAMTDDQLDYYGKKIADSGANDEYLVSEQDRRNAIAERINSALEAAEDAKQAASVSRDTATALAEAALRAEEQAELSATEAQEAAAAAVRAKEKEKEAKAESRLAAGRQKESEAREDTEAASEAAGEAQKAAQKAAAAAETSRQAAEAAQTAAGESETAAELRLKVQEASERAAAYAQKAQEKADAALEAATAAQNATDLAEAASAAADAADANAEAQQAATETEQAASGTDIATEDADGSESEEEIAPPSISAGKLLLGAVCGIFLYGMLLVCWIIFRPKVCEETCSEMLADRRTVRVRRLEEPSGFWDCLHNDVYVWRWRNRNTPTFEQQMEDAGSMIRFLSRKDGVAEPVLAAVGRLTDSSSEILEQLSQEAADDAAALETVLLDGEERKRYFDEIEQLKDVLLVSEYGKTDLRILQKVLQDMKQFGVRCEGHIVLGS